MAIAGSGVNAQQMWIEDGKLRETKSSCAGNLAVDDVDAAITQIMAGEKIYVLLYGLTVPNVRAKVNERLGAMSQTENDLMVERALEISRVQVQVRDMLLVFINERHANLLARKIMSEFLTSDMIDDCYLKCFEMIQQTERK